MVPIKNKMLAITTNKDIQSSGFMNFGWERLDVLFLVFRYISSGKDPHKLPRPPKSNGSIVLTK